MGSISAEQRRAMFNVMRPHDKVSNLSTDRLKEGNNGTRKSVGRSLRCNEDTTDVINYNVNATNASKRSSPNHRLKKQQHYGASIGSTQRHSGGAAGDVGD